MDEWFDWRTGLVIPTGEVEVLLRNGTLSRERADRLVWRIDNSEFDILRYRHVSPPLHIAEDGTIKPLVENIPSDVLLQVGGVFSFGAKKYSETLWKDKPTSSKKRIGSALRHIYKHLTGEAIDPESGETHLSHAITQLMMALHYINKGIE